MVCKVKIYERPKLTDPVLIEGLPGIGLVANIAVAYLIKKLDVRLFCEITSSHFHDMVITGEGGILKYPVNQLYYFRGSGFGGRDLILLYGNTQALTPRGQYELCGCILDVAEELDCKFVITLGGYRPNRTVVKPKLYFAASDDETAKIARELGAEPLKISIFGVAGLLIGLCKIRGMRGLCLLSETPGNYPDREAAAELLKALSQVLKIKVDASGLGRPEDLINVLSPFDFGALSRRREVTARPEWFI
ncbi:MAG: PAC2 family protein [Candidatus Bathyarchaeia archaeon]|nr:PAC2 family protein [Candidatus Bathyarchaeota archaeon]